MPMVFSDLTAALRVEVEDLFLAACLPQLRCQLP
jgi:hypothetical protein